MSSNTQAPRVEVAPGEQKDILIETVNVPPPQTKTTHKTQREGSTATLLSAVPSETHTTTTTVSEPVADVTIHLEGEHNAKPTATQEITEDAKETVKKGFKVGAKSLAGKMARGGLKMLARSLQSPHHHKTSPKTPPAEDEAAHKKSISTSLKEKSQETAESVKEKAKESAEAVKEKAKETAETVKEKTEAGAQKTKLKTQQLLKSVTEVAMKAAKNMSSGKEVPAGEHSAPIEHWVAVVAQFLHKNSSVIGHSIAGTMRRMETIVEKDETKRKEILEELSIEKLLLTGSVQRRHPSELTSIQDINMAVHEITDLIAHKVLRLRNKLVERETMIDYKERHAKDTGDDVIRHLEHSIKDRLLGYAVKGAASVSETVTEKTGVDINVPEVTGKESVEVCHTELVNKGESSDVQNLKEEKQSTTSSQKIAA
mmetsp:Transcript_1873/g.6650  ORF Transcript_1873/g.6650 Transcript_1873/m.6650 type:complete len:428 (+) Transcript_1873:1064-2347(+)